MKRILPYGLSRMGVDYFENTIQQTSAYNMASMESTMSQNTFSLGLTWRF